MTLAVIQTHPIQYYAPIYRHLEQALGVPTVAIYGTDASLTGYQDEDFAERIAWDVDLTSGYRSMFLGHGPLDRISTRGLAAALRDVRPCAVLLTGYSPRFNLMSVLRARRSGLPLMLRAEASDVSHPRTAIKSIARDALLKRLYRDIDAFLYVGYNAHAHYRRLGVSESRLTFSPLSVSDAHFRPASDAHAVRGALRARFAIDDRRCVVLFSGKFIRKKSPTQLLAAARRLDGDTRRSLTLLFMGEGALRGELERGDGDEAGLQVRVAGFVNQSQVSELYHACDLLALPSLFQETWGLVVNEALMHGKPCVVSDRVGCAPDLIDPGVTGFVHRHDDVDDLAAQLAACVALSRREQTATNCINKVANYSIARAAEGIRDALNGVLQRRTAARACNQIL